MPAKKSRDDGTRKSSTSAAEPKPPKPLNPEITVQNLPQSTERELVTPEATPEATNTEGKNFLAIPNPLTDAEEHLISVLLKLQGLHDTASETNAIDIAMELTTFTKIATSIQKAWEYVKAAKRAHEEKTILKPLKDIQASIASLEQKYENIEATTNRIENKHKDIERTVKDAPKTYADIVNASATSTKEKETAEMRARQRQHRDALRQERAKYEVTLTTKQTTDKVKEQITTMAPKEITERCQQAVEKASIPGVKLQGINKIVNGIRVRCATEEQANQLRAIDWNEAFEGIKTHEPIYGIVINGMPIDDLDLDDPRTIKLLEAANGFPSGTIAKVTPLRRKDKAPSSKTKHRSIVIYLKNIHIANKCIMNGCYINYLHYMPLRFIPQFQITQCFNCCEYGHRATSCKRKPRCGKCAGKHNTKESDSTTVQCAHCKGPHEAWRHECPAWIAEKHRLEELRDRCPDLFTV